MLRQNSQFRVSVFRAQAFFFVGILFFTAMGFLAVYASLETPRKIWLVSIALFFFAGFELFLLLRSGPIEVDTDGIRTNTPIGYFGMAWSEVKSIAIYSADMWVLGNDKHLVLIAPNFWSGKHKDEALKVVQENIYRIQNNKKPNLILPWSKNCKIKKED